MKKKESEEMERFNKTLDGLLAVPHSELKKKLDEEDKAKKKKSTSSSGRVSSKGS